MKVLALDVTDHGFDGGAPSIRCSLCSDKPTHNQPDWGSTPVVSVIDCAKMIVPKEDETVRWLRPKSFIVPSPLKAFGRKGASQNDESGILDAILSAVPVRRKFFVEFGIGPNWQDPEYTRGLEGNCVDLSCKGWAGLFMDGNEHPPRYGVAREFITAANINALLHKYQVPPDFSIISIDVDGQDLWIWEALQYDPEVVVVEYNANFGLSDCVSIPLDPEFRWDGTKYFGASLGALDKIGRSKGYRLVYANGVNAFFIRAHFIKNIDDFAYNAIFVQLDLHQPDPHHRKFVPI